MTSNSSDRVTFSNAALADHLPTGHTSYIRTRRKVALSCGNSRKMLAYHSLGGLTLNMLQMTSGATSDTLEWRNAARG
jgi:hypothetical protein